MKSEGAKEPWRLQSWPHALTSGMLALLAGPMTGSDGGSDLFEATTATRTRLKELLIERLRLEDLTPDDIGDDDPLFEGGLGLDSIDALEIVVMLEGEFGIKLKNEPGARESFKSVSALAQLVDERTKVAGGSAT